MKKPRSASFRHGAMKKRFLVWRGHLALVYCRWQDTNVTQGRDGLATSIRFNPINDQKHRALLFLFTCVTCRFELNSSVPHHHFQLFLFGLFFRLSGFPRYFYLHTEAA
jgi:hypothetical protein